MRKFYETIYEVFDRISDIFKMYFSVEYEQTCILPDWLFLKLKYKKTFGHSLHLLHPKTFNEKLQWLKLHDRNPLYTRMVDKYDVKTIVENAIGAEYVIPNYGVWEKFDDIDFERLPKQFVLKSTHDSGGVYIVNDKDSMNPQQIKQFFDRRLLRSHYKHGREWPYKNVKPRIIAEKFMVDESGYELKDYKFFCFNGEPKVMFIASDRQVEDEETKFDFFDMDFKHLPFTNGHPNSKKEIKCPQSFESMKELAKKLAQGIPCVRVDFYEINGKIYFGELTFFHCNGMIPFEPEEWDYKLGEWINL